MAAPESGADEKPSSATFGRFAGRGRTVIVLALEEARMLNHDSIGTEHILLGLIREGEGVAAQALESLGIDLEAVRQQVVEITGQGEQAPPEHIPFTARAKRVLELSLREAMQLGHNYIGTEHILLGLIREGDGVAAQVLVRLGADLNQVRHQVIQLLAAAPPAGVTGTGDVELRLSAVEQRAGIAPDTADLDQQIRQARTDKGAAPPPKTTSGPRRCATGKGTCSPRRHHGSSSGQPSTRTCRRWPRWPSRFASSARPSSSSADCSASMAADRTRAPHERSVEDVREVHRPGAAGCCPGARRSQDARSRLHWHGAHPARPHS